ncbi:pH-response regulator protein palH/rim21 [Coniosporium tulheliwenetii]|uniref:PH-response regulator protein palH/rim21 n=1 Tax=Coniosporium tulheliwenetii TaxID=3383036 RepID=A0ACC2YQN8_9PEZI|nr:pH-response regulator protein palH/rim21 [Cladosporium sp. JES 115]
MESPSDPDVDCTDDDRCTLITLAFPGVVILNPTSTVTLPAEAVFTPECTNIFEQGRHDASIVADREKPPFYASTAPQVYATGAATVIAWMLVVMLLITPRTFFVGGSGGRSGLMGRRGMISGATGGASVIGVGSRPWLQKVAALTVAISMTIATADTFRVAGRQYYAGVMNASELRRMVVAGLELSISRIISDVFLWLAQVQTLIRLFPRHKEKVIIKWVGFALIVLDMSFSCVNIFVADHPNGRPRRFVDAIPALSYLFQLALSMLYAAWVIYYVISKRRYAFYHSMMWNISVVALLSIIAILTPIVFFITDISNDDVAGWGDYFRWVGAAAASVVVWEWVERIEALEREEKKDGILGREIFDGDEMLEVTTSGEVVWPRKRRTGGRKPDDEEGGGGVFASRPVGQGISGMAHRLGAVGRSRFRPANSFRPLIPLGRAHSATTDRRNGIGSTPGQEDATTSPHIPTPPPAVSTPVNRADNASAASTVYAGAQHDDTQSVNQNGSNRPNVERRGSQAEIPTNTGRGRPRWQAVPNPFKRKRYSPPPEVRNASIMGPQASLQVSSKQQPVHSYARWDLKSRLGAFAAEQGERFHERSSNRRASVDLPVTVIPAQPRGRAWSPETMRTPTSLNRVVADSSNGPSPTTASGKPESADTTSRSAASSDNQRGRTIQYADQEPPSVSNGAGSSQRTSATTTTGAVAADVAAAAAPKTEVQPTEEAASSRTDSEGVSRKNSKNIAMHSGGSLCHISP